MLTESSLPVFFFGHRLKNQAGSHSALSFEDLSFSYRDAPTLKNISLHLENEFACLLGQNGSGKSTLLKCANGIIPKIIKGKFQGSVKVFGEDIKKKTVAQLAHDIGMVFQNPDSQLFALTVEEELAFAPENLKLPRDEIGKRISEALHLVNMEGYGDNDPQELSMGQKQKICIASVLVMQPKILLLDEPFSLLDNKSAKEIFKILEQLHTHGTTILLVDHNWSRAKKLKRAIVIDKGEIALDGSPFEISKTKKFQDLELV